MGPYKAGHVFTQTVQQKVMPSSSKKIISLLKGIIQIKMSEKLKAVSNPENLMLTWQKQVLDKRYEEYTKRELKLQEWEDIHKGLRDKYA